MEYDIAVIGGGPAGYSAALKGARMGAKVVLFERENLGGVCLNAGCIPTKSYVAQESGVVTAMDTAWDARGRWLSLIRPMLAHLDWFMPSVEEAEQMIGTREPGRLAEAFRALGVKNVVIKLGSRGCYVQPQGEEGRYFGIFPAKAVDTAGAGDAWCAGFLAGLVNGLSVDAAAVVGNAAGAMCVTQVGTTTGIRSFAETQEYARQNG